MVKKLKLCYTRLSPAPAEEHAGTVVGSITPSYTSLRQRPLIYRLMRLLHLPSQPLQLTFQSHSKREQTHFFSNGDSYGKGDGGKLLRTRQSSVGHRNLATNNLVNMIRAKRNPCTIRIEGIHSSNTSNYTVDLNLSSAVDMSEENINIVCHVVNRPRNLIPGPRSIPS